MTTPMSTILLVIAICAAIMGASAVAVFAPIAVAILNEALRAWALRSGENG